MRRVLTASLALGLASVTWLVVSATAASAGRHCTITGSAQADVLKGTPGRDVICGGGGNDTIRGRGGNDTIYGDNGRDRLYGAFGADTIYGGAQNDFVDGGRGNDVVKGGPDLDLVNGGPGDDQAFGGGGSDIVTGIIGNDVVHGGAGSDRCLDVFDGVRGNDTVFGGPGVDHYQADPGDFHHSAEVRGPCIPGSAVPLAGGSQPPEPPCGGPSFRGMLRRPSRDRGGSKMGEQADALLERLVGVLDRDRRDDERVSRRSAGPVRAAGGDVAHLDRAGRRGRDRGTVRARVARATGRRGVHRRRGPERIGGGSAVHALGRARPGPARPRCADVLAAFRGCSSQPRSRCQD